MTTYRLPDWLGGHKVEHIDEKHAAGGAIPVVLMRLVGGEYDGLIVAVREDDLVEVKPPSIDDPVDLPVEIEDDFADACLVLQDGPDPLIRIRVREEHLVARRGMYVTAVMKPTPEGLRDLARAAWKLGTEQPEATS